MHVRVDSDNSDETEQLLPSAKQPVHVFPGASEEHGQKSSEFSPATSVRAEEYQQKSGEFATAPSALGTEFFDLSPA